MAPRVVLSRRLFWSCHAGEVWVKRQRLLLSAIFSITAIATGWLAVGDGDEVKIDDGFQRLGRRAVAQPLGQSREPIRVGGLERE